MYERASFAQDEAMRSAAMDLFEQALKLDDTLATPYVFRGRYMTEKSRNFLDAIVEYDRALERAPRHPMALTLKAAAQLVVGLNEEAVATLKILETVNPSRECWVMMSEAYLRLGQIEKMEAVHEKLRAAGHEPPDMLPWVPRPVDRVTDLADVFTEERRSGLIDTLTKYEQETSHQIAVLTVPDLRGEPIDVFSLRVARSWGVGQRSHDNGILVTVAVGDRRVRIEVGRGLEEAIPDSLAAEILDEHMIQAFKGGDLQTGIEVGVGKLMVAARRLVIPAEEEPQDPRSVSTSLVSAQEATTAQDTNGDAAVHSQASPPISFEVAWIAREEPRPFLLPARTPDLPGTPQTPDSDQNLAPLCSEIRPVDDLDGDGVSDLLVGRGALYFGRQGGMRVLSGSDGRWLAQHGHRVHYDHLGVALCDIGDVDGDGVADYAAGAPCDMWDPRAGYVAVYSGKTHDVLRVLEGIGSSHDMSGTSLASLGDVDGDGVADLAVGAPDDAFKPGLVWAASGSDGQVLWSFEGKEGENLVGHDIFLCREEGLLVRVSVDVLVLAPRTGHVIRRVPLPSELPTQSMVYDGTLHSMVCIGDADGDGDHDLAVSMRRRAPGGGAQHGCSIFVLEGRTGEELLSIHPREGDTWFGWSLEAVSDMDGDGMADLLTRAVHLGTPTLLWLSSRSGEILGSFPQQELSSAFCSVGDRNGDGIDEVAVTGTGGADNGLVYLLRSVVLER